jgi:hypothetical protein
MARAGGIASALMLAAATFLGGCHNDASPGTGQSGGSFGPVIVSITDAASDQVSSFIVEVSTIRLVNTAGSEVAVLAAPVQVDLAQLTDIAQVIGFANVPAGLYTQANITIDLFGADLHLAGNSASADIVDATGAPVNGSILLPVQFDAPISVAVNTQQRLELDFDLDQSMTVDVPGNTVTLEPAFVLRVNPAAPKQLFVTGILSSINTGTSMFTAAVQGAGGGTIANLNFHTSGTTVFQIDGEPLTGAPGLLALNQAGAGTAVQCYGVASTSSDRIEVSTCIAGTGSFDGGTDLIDGYIVGRTGGPGANAVLQVFGQSIDAGHTNFTFGTTFVVNTDFTATNVVRLGSSTIFDTDDLNIGQRVKVYGTLTGTTMDATSVDSVVRLERVRVFGVAAGPPAGIILTIDLLAVGQLPEAAFTWTDGGGSPPDPDLFSIDVGTLGNGLQIVAGSNAEARGFFPAIDDVNADFDADALSNADSAASTMIVRNVAVGGFTVNVTTTTTDIQLGIVGAAGPGEVALVDQGLVGTTPLPAAPTPTIMRTGGTGSYSLRDRSTGAFLSFTQFSDYASAVGSMIGQGATLIQIGATGVWNAGTNTIDATVSTAIIE